MRKNFMVIAVVALALLFMGCTQYIVYWPIHGDDNGSENVTVESTETEGVYIVGLDSELPVTVMYSNGTTKTIMVPADVIIAAAGTESGLKTLRLTYDGISFTVEVYVPESDNIETDPNYINSAEKLISLFTDNNTDEKVAILASDVSLSVSEIDIISNVSNLHIYSTDPENTITVTGTVSSEAVLYFNTGSDITLEGFTIKDANSNTDEPKPLLKAHGITGLVLKDMRFETNERGLDLNGNEDVEILDCTITKTSRAFGDLQLRNATGVIVNGLTIEDKVGTNNIGTVVFNYVASASGEIISTGAVFSNLNGVDLIYGPTDTGITVNSTELTASDVLVSNGYFLYATEDGLAYMESLISG